MIKTISLSLLISLATIALNAQTLTLKIDGIKKKPGKILLAFFNSQEEFKSEIPKYGKEISMSDIKNGRIIISYDDIEPGTYGIALLHDTDGDGKMSYSYFIPSEGFGFSDYEQKGVHKPRFKDFAFEFGPEDKTVYIKVKYM